MKINEYIDYGSCATQLLAVLPGKTQLQIANALESYFQDRSDYDDIVYSASQLNEFVLNLMAEFVAEQQNETRSAALTAIQLQMPLSENTVTIHTAGGLL